MAYEALRARLRARESTRASHAREEKRRAQVGSGMRGDKRRTIRVRDGVVKDHVLGREWKLRKYLRGDWD
jgi:protein subunit release factor A